MNNEHETNPLLRRAIIFLENGDWENADIYCERTLDEEPENGQAYLIKMMAALHITKEEDLGSLNGTFEHWNMYKNAYRFADDALKERLEGYLIQIENRCKQQEAVRLAREKERQELDEARRNEVAYVSAMNSELVDNIVSLQRAAEVYESIGDYKDSVQRAAKCREMIARKKEERRRNEEEEAEKDTQMVGIIAISVAAVIAISIILFVVILAIT